ncbi:DNA repair and recombination protein rhm52 [Cladophialophora carrionii]|uniref:RAD52 homolog n=1 Tax=Cladophialophora carrionii TaxID=86049 RepID=A0A1C1CYW7_9EURO|nr:DNA repair and recombination protein rhm52 [Cladophialophora carrionii]
MPAVGDQHKPNGSTTSNPFEDQPLRITEYTAQEIATLQSRLDKQLGPEYISSRAGPGGSKVHYLAAEKAISLANEVFGFNGWSSSIQNIQIDFVDENAQTGKVSLGLSVIVRVTLKDGTHHEDIGYGQIDNCKGKAAAFEKAKKEGTTDALKRALRNFGNVLGNCVYDKAYLQKVTKLKVGATKWDESMLHRHADFAPKKEADEVKRILPAAALEGASEPARPNPTVLAQEDPTEFEDSFELADFEEMDFCEDNMGHPDEVALPAAKVDPTRKSANSAPERSFPPPRADLTTPSKQQLTGPPGPRPEASRAPQISAPSNVIPQPLPGQRAQAPSGPATRPPAENVPRLSSPPQTGQVMGFYSAKAADSLDGNNSVIGGGPAAAPRFNPHADSPSIRKTSGVNHSKSVPLKRDLSVDTTPIRRDLVNPQAEQLRRVGAPGTSGQFAGTRGPSTSAYRPPTRRGPLESNATHGSNLVEVGAGDRGLQAAKRTPLGDVSNVQHHVTAVTTDGADAKRQRVAEALPHGEAGTTNNQPSSNDA